MEAIKTINLTKKYKDLTAVDDVNLQIEQGELFALLGVNGAGKSTMVKMLSCLTRPTGGDAFVGGHSILREEAKVKAMIGVSPQETAVAENLSVKENLELICGIYGYSTEQTDARIKDLSSQFHLQDVLGKRAYKLSGGWKRKSAFAWRLSASPKSSSLTNPPWAWM